ncbi:MAG TPA: hypothetical protein DD000_21325, partial [Cyanobacteria bacterium UBA11166]|nr:hypothetical protein [Cyanobacteria bacterium UBA11166]
MNNSHQPEDRLSNSEESLADLAWAIEGSLGQFSLILARCNYASLQSRLMERLREVTNVNTRVIQLQPSDKKLYQKIKFELGNESPEALMILGFESIKDIDYLVTAANQVREEFRQHFPFPMVWWVNDEVLQKLIRLAPDFESWGTITEFAIASDQLVDLLRQSSNRVFSAILEAGGSQFLTNGAMLGTGYRLEVESASRDIELEPDLEASLQFIWGREDYQCDRIDDALSRYQESLDFWNSKSPDSPPPNPYSLQRKGILLLHIGWCYCRQAELAREESHRHWQDALGYFQEVINIFEQLKSPELVGKFINEPAQLLQKLEYWQELETLAKKSLALHKRYGTEVQIAQDYGFLAEVALARSHWQKAHQLAEKSLKIIHDISPEKRQNQGLYLLLLGLAQQQLNKLDLAVKSLELAKEKTNPQDDPLLYIRILDKLRSLYFYKSEYLKAFEVKQYQRLIERQYGFRAFIGASRLQPQVRETLAPEIAASGRGQDVNRLIERICLPQHKLTIIYGQSGVGKSSVLEAGLVPALKDQSINTRDVLPIYIRVYTDWLRMVGKELAEALGEKGETMQFIESEDVAGILAQLRHNESKNILTVLIFDQFEEFFFVFKQEDKRRSFFEFLQSCLNISFVKVILSLREDYLHLLLAGCRPINLGAINNNILDKDILYYLGNFAPEDGRNIIRSLTAKSQVNLEDALVDRLVEELAVELGEIRPIELQVVGAQLQTDGITTLDRYLQFGSKERLVARYLEEVIEDCGKENQKTAELVLYLLTDDNGNRPLKTRAEIIADLVAIDNLDLVLEILVKSGLVFEISEVPANRYQLVHDYL